MLYECSNRANFNVQIPLVVGVMVSGFYVEVDFFHGVFFFWLDYSLTFIKIDIQIIYLIDDIIVLA